MRLTDKSILVVGASHGIGRAVAEKLARKGNRVAITGRNQDTLDAAQKEIQRLGENIRCITFASDALNEKQAADVVKETAKQFGGIDVALINVGGAKALRVAKAEVKEITKTMNINYHACINSFVPLVEVMKHQPNGGIIAHTNSLAGFQGLPLSSHYSASKAAMRIFLDAARIELRKHKIRICTLCPGFVATRSHDDGKVPTPFIISPEKAAKKMVRAIARERRVKTFPWQLALATYIGTKVPKFILEPIMAKAGS